MSLEPPTTVSSLATPVANDDEEQHSVVSEVFDTHTTFNVPENVSSGTMSSPEPTQSLHADQTHQAAVLAEDPFDSEASHALFDAIDQFQSCGTVSSRTAPGTPNKVEITITPPDFNTEHFGYAQDGSYKEYHWEGASISVEEFKEIVNLVSTRYMGINAGHGEDKKNFAVEVLKVKVTGPNRSHFSILDLPGIISYAHNVRENEMNGVRDLVAKYMARREHIVICVADACSDLSNQEIFKLAAQHVDKERLIGVFTKCDLKTENIESVVCIANGADEDSQAHDHEWFVVRNKTNAEQNDPKFNQLEAENNLFNKRPWNNIPQARRGSSMLKKYLARLLCDKIRDAFPQLIERLTAKLRQAEERRNALGDPRVTYEEQRSYLVNIAKRYENLASEAMKEPWELGNADYRARTIIREANEAFANEMREKGHAYEFQDHSITEEECIVRLEAALPLCTNHNDAKNDDGKALPLRTNDTEARNDDGKDNNDNDYDDDVDFEKIPLFAVIREEVAVCSSTELPGMVNTKVISRLYMLQSQKWHQMADTHVQKVAVAIATASVAILKEACSPSGHSGSLFKEIMHMLEKAHNEHLAELSERLKTYCDGEQSKILQTTDPAFLRKRQLLRSLRIAKGLRRAQEKLTKNRRIMSVEKLGSLVCNECHLSSTNNTVAEVHDTLKVYYEVSHLSRSDMGQVQNSDGRQVSLNAFIRHVTNDIIEGFVRDPRNPLRRFSSDYMYSLSEADVRRLGAESSEVSKERENLTKRIGTLKSVWEAGQLAMAKAAAVA
ncbi:hypothetical protein K4F52_007805 [Lecanicillium sp. MT-2017a]|nr:hypothetical protein K4F52_007805 [Lecanicillium sp. MT-2017a]